MSSSKPEHLKPQDDLKNRSLLVSLSRGGHPAWADLARRVRSVVIFASQTAWVLDVPRSKGRLTADARHQPSPTAAVIVDAIVFDQWCISSTDRALIDAIARNNYRLLAW